MTSWAAVQPTSGCEPAPRPSVACTPIWMMRSAREVVSAWASVLATTKSTPWRPAAIMLLTALPPAPPTPNTVIRGFSSRMSGIFKLMLMGCLSEAFAKPLSHPGEIAARPRLDVPRVARFEMFQVRKLRIDQKPSRHGEGRSPGGLRQPRNAKRTAHAHRPAQNAGRQFANAGQLTGSAGENNAALRFCGKRRRCKAVAHHLEDLLSARLDDPREFGPRHKAWRLTVLAADGRYGDHIALIR